MLRGKNRHILYWRKKEIIACGGQVTTDCFIYFISNDTWALYASSNYSSGPNGLYNNKMYFSPYSNIAEVLDLTTKAWSTWPLSPFCTVDGCQVTWRDAFVRFGGSDDGCGRVVQMFNHTTRTWSNLDTLPYTASFLPGCALLPGDKVFLIGGGYGADLKKFTVYDLNAKKWTVNGTQSYDLPEPVVVMLGKRVFVIQGYVSSNLVQEFHYGNNSFTIPQNGALTAFRSGGPAAVSVPAGLFRNPAQSCTGVF